MFIIVEYMIMVCQKVKTLGAQVFIIYCGGGMEVVKSNIKTLKKVCQKVKTLGAQNCIYNVGKGWWVVVKPKVKTLEKVICQKVKTLAGLCTSTVFNHQ